MLLATTIVRRPAVRPERVADTLTLPHAGRTGAAAEFTGAGGLAFRLALDRPSALDDGDAVKLEDGRLVLVKAAEERLLEVTAGSPARLARIAWHLGGAHVPVEVDGEALFVPADAGTAELARGLGAVLRDVSRPFRPERASHGHHDCGHDHGHGAHGHHAHVHGPECGHDHGAHGHHHHGQHRHG